MLKDDNTYGAGTLAERKDLGIHKKEPWYPPLVIWYPISHPHISETPISAEWTLLGMAGSVEIVEAGGKDLPTPSPTGGSLKQSVVTNFHCRPHEGPHTFCV